MVESIQPMILIILDGWGVREETLHNPIKLATTPVMDQLISQYPHTLVDASGTAVGLPAGQIGNSEVGHLHIGAGRKVPQDLTRINNSIINDEFYKNPTFLKAIEYAKKENKKIQILGLLSTGGVHSHLGHFEALLKLLSNQNFKNAYIHAFLDGRDTLPQSAAESIKEITALADHLGTGKIASLIGRYYAMDRDQRWQRTEQAYNLLTTGKADFFAPDPLTGLAMAYDRGEKDEFVKPTMIQQEGLISNTLIESGDIIVFMNFRADRARQLCKAFIEPNFSAFQRKAVIQPGQFITLTEYAKNLNVDGIAFPAVSLANGLGEFLAHQALPQLRIAETEKYAHVTYFLNGGQEIAFNLEDRILVPSPKVATYDLQPEMSANELTDRLVEAIQSRKHAAIFCNYANPDMVGHTGIETAAISAIMTIDHCLGRVIKSALENNFEVLITSDHGNVEQIYDENTKQPHTAHTNNLVPLIYVGRPASFQESTVGSLDDIAPTFLYLMGLLPPKEMTGQNLIKLN